MTGVVVQLPRARSSRNPMRSGYAPSTKPDQRIYTPTVIPERILLKLWRRGIGYDPFPGVGAPVSLLAARCCAGDGFVELLVDRSFANPPFARLKEAMSKFRGHSIAKPKHELVLLGPAQTHRTWFWDCGGDLTAWLRPLAFEGFKQTYPKPLCLHYYGPRPHLFYELARASGLVVRVTGSVRS